MLVVGILANLENYIEGLSEISLCYEIETYEFLIPLPPPDLYLEGLLQGAKIIYLSSYIVGIEDYLDDWMKPNFICVRDL